MVWSIQVYINTVLQFSEERSSQQARPQGQVVQCSTWLKLCVGTLRKRMTTKLDNFKKHCKEWVQNIKNQSFKMGNS